MRDGPLDAKPETINADVAHVGIGSADLKPKKGLASRTHYPGPMGHERSTVVSLRQSRLLASCNYIVTFCVGTRNRGLERWKIVVYGKTARETLTASGSESVECDTGRKFDINRLSTLTCYPGVID